MAGLIDYAHLESRKTANMSIKRRTLIQAAGLTLLTPAATAMAVLKLTPRQSEGPFYPEEIPLDSDADLVQVEGMSRPATGIVVHLTGNVVDINGKPVSGAKVEIWQCDAFGNYKHPRDRGDRSEPEFQGYGTTSTLKTGEFRFRTIRPARYTGRTPHIHAKITPPGSRTLTTQFFVEGEQRNETDFLYRRIPEDLRGMVTARYPASPEESNTVIPNYSVVVR